MALIPPVHAPRSVNPDSPGSMTSSWFSATAAPPGKALGIAHTLAGSGLRNGPPALIGSAGTDPTEAAAQRSQLDSKRFAGDWFSTLMCGAIASATSANQQRITFSTPSLLARHWPVTPSAARGVAGVAHWESLRRSTSEEWAAWCAAWLNRAGGACQGETAFPEDFLEMPLTPRV